MIAVVDDDEAILASTESLLRSLGHEVSTFRSAVEFLESGRLHDTSCVITDVQMPGLTGVELQSRLIAQDHRIPIVFITAFPEEPIRVRVMKAGAVGFLSKPYRTDDLIACLEKALH
jgi:FixJ family two-component response regulator